MIRHACWLVLLAFVGSIIAISCQHGEPGPKAKPATVTPTPKPTAAATKPVPAATKGAWTIAFKGDFAGTKLDDKWLILHGDATVKDGALILNGGQAAGQIMLKQVFDGSSVRVAYAATIAKTEKVSDISTILNSTSAGLSEGYFLQFDGKGGTVNQILKDNNDIQGTTNKKLLPLETGKKYAIVAENDKGHITLKVNGEIVLDYTDAKPLSGIKNGMVGLYVWGQEVKIEDFVISTKK